MNWAIPWATPEDASGTQFDSAWIWAAMICSGMPDSLEASLMRF